MIIVRKTGNMQCREKIAGSDLSSRVNESGVGIYLLASCSVVTCWLVIL
jgi:hypothetical protein